MEFVFEYITELLFAAFVRSKTCKPWVKTAVVSILFGMITLFSVFIFYVGLQSGHAGSVIAGGLLALIFGIYGFAYTVKRHKGNWEKEISRS